MKQFQSNSSNEMVPIFCLPVYSRDSPVHTQHSKKTLNETAMTRVNLAHHLSIWEENSQLVLLWFLATDWTSLWFRWVVHTRSFLFLTKLECAVYNLTLERWAKFWNSMHYLRVDTRLTPCFPCGLCTWFFRNHPTPSTRVLAHSECPAHA